MNWMTKMTAMTGTTGFTRTLGLAWITTCRMNRMTGISWMGGMSGII